MDNRTQVERQADAALLSSGVLGPRVLTVAADCHSTEAEIMAMARGVCAQLRKLQWQGYDLRHGEMRCFLLRDDTPAEPGTYNERGGRGKRQRSG